MAVVNISLDFRTGDRTASAPGFSAVLSRSPLNPNWYTVHVTAGPPAVCERLSGQLGTLDNLKRAMEAML